MPTAVKIVLPLLHACYMHARADTEISVTAMEGKMHLNQYAMLEDTELQSNSMCY